MIEVLFFVMMTLSHLDKSRLADSEHDFPAQEDFIATGLYKRPQITAAFGGLQSGKTLGAADLLYLLLYGDNPHTLPPHLAGKTPMEVWILSKSYALVDTALSTFRMRVPEDVWMTDSECRKYGLKRHDSRTWWLRPRELGLDTLPIILRGRTAADPEAMRATPTLGVAWGDECAHWKQEAWQNLLGRGIVARPKFILSTTPKGKNWLYRDVYVPGMSGFDESISVHKWRSIDNPYADKEYINKLRVKFGKDYAEQELDALFTANVGYVYDFDRAQHMSRPLTSQNPKDYPIRILGVDPGYGDPYAVGVWLRDAAGSWWLAEEFYQTRRTTEEIIPWFRSICEKWDIQMAYVDKRRPSDRISLTRAGIPAMANLEFHAENDRRTVMPMIRMCQQLFKQGKINITPHCEWFAEEAENYAFPDGDDKNMGENPVDFRNHHMDAMRYAICSVEEMPKGGNRYRQGSTQTPKEVNLGGGEKKIPTMAESLAAQDEEMDRAQERNQGGMRNTHPRWLANRLRTRSRI